ncbi:DEAD/DEAH box helicase [candidate division KSB1 bacterium]|nr:DEAD/DEAH box helicase [candidate division KSB1 bacterium]
MHFHKFKLDARLMSNINRAGYKTPTPIQVKAIPIALEGYDLIGTAQTGTGKTAAFVLPVLQKLLRGERKIPRALIITPTRELAAQIHENIRNFSKGTHVRSITIFGGVPLKPQIDALRKGVEILVACPGRLLDLIEKGHVSLKSLDSLILDEADRMLDMGFLPDVRRILKFVPSNRQTSLFSATFPKEIYDLAAETLTKPQRIDISKSLPVNTVSHALYPVEQHLKNDLMLALLKQTDTKSVLAFTRTRRRAHILAQKIERKGFKVTSLHSDRSQAQRQAALKGFKNGKYQIMVATDIAARGLDIESISHVINYDMPATADDYIHRIGRTGRAERTGDAFTLITRDDEKLVKKLENVMGEKLLRKSIPGFNYAQPVKQYGGNNSGKKNNIRFQAKTTRTMSTFP